MADINREPGVGRLSVIELDKLIRDVDNRAPVGVDGSGPEARRPGMTVVVAVERIEHQHASAAAKPFAKPTVVPKSASLF